MDDVFPLSQGNLSSQYAIVEIRSSDRIKRRLLDLGFVDSIIRIEKKSIKGGVYLLNLRGFLLAIKKEEVEGIMVKNVL